MQMAMISRENVERECDQLRAKGFTLFIVDAPNDTAHFFSLAKVALPLDPPISGRVHWDAFADSLWGGLDECALSKIALVLRDAGGIRRWSETDFQMILDIMRQAASEVEAEKQNEGVGQAEIRVVVGIT